MGTRLNDKLFRQFIGLLKPSRQALQANVLPRGLSDLSPNLVFSPTPQLHEVLRTIDLATLTQVYVFFLWAPLKTPYCIHQQLLRVPFKLARVSPGCAFERTDLPNFPTGLERDEVH